MIFSPIFYLWFLQKIKNIVIINVKRDIGGALCRYTLLHTKKVGKL